METQRLIMSPREDLILVDGEQVSRTALLNQLERVVESSYFRNSKRYPTFLRFVVEQTLSGSTDSLKERTLGVEVFSRSSDYDTNADPIVRVTAGEIRKRLAQYYQEPGHEHELKIELPLGSYVPHFIGLPALSLPPRDLSVREAGLLAEPDRTGMDREPSEEVGPPLVQAPVKMTLLPDGMSVPKHADQARPWLIPVLVAALLLIAGVLGEVVHARRPEGGLQFMWQAALASPAPAMIVIGVHSLNSQGREQRLESSASAIPEQPGDMLTAMVRSDMVPVSDIVSYSHVTDLLTSRSHPYTTLGSSAATIEELRKGPVILIGGLDNIWTLRLASKLRFRFTSKDTSESTIVDRDHPESGWHFDNMQQAIVNTRDYAIVASYYDSSIEEPVLIIAGIGKSGTEIAAEFVTNNASLQAWMKSNGLARTRNVELVLSTEIVDGKAGPPHVIASTIW